jgi:tRNA pseudouridine38-40 synthase
MSRYFIEVSYKGTQFSGFQSQHNANTIQAEVEKAINMLFPFTTAEEINKSIVSQGESASGTVQLTGSSRTDTGVHAIQNFFHFDSILPVQEWKGMLPAHSGWENCQRNFLYKMNAVLPPDIVVKSLWPVSADAHCRFDAVSRDYRYFVYRHKDPFLKERAFYFPYKLDVDKMKQAASLLMGYTDFTSFSKRNTQVKSFICRLYKSEWEQEGDGLVYHVRGNRFLRGMVRALVATMLKVGRNKVTIDEFRQIIEAKDCTKASFAVPAHGLFLMGVQYPAGYFPGNR